MSSSDDRPTDDAPRVPLWTIAAGWTRIGVTGFGGPPAHIALLNQLCVRRRGWLTEEGFSDGVAATALLPGPASTQLAIYCAWRLRGNLGALIGGIGFIAPGLVATVALAALVFAGNPSRPVLGAAAGAGAAVVAVAVRACADLVPASWQRAATGPPTGGAATGTRPAGPGCRGWTGGAGAGGEGAAGGRAPARRAGRQAGSRRWVAYLVLGAAATVSLGAWVAAAILAAGSAEWALRRRPGPARRRMPSLPVLAGWLGAPATLATLGWTAFKVGALSYGGGFVIIPLMQADAVDRYHWMTGGQFLSAVVLGQLTPGPVVHTVAVVGYAAAGVAGALYAAAVAFLPSFAFVMLGATRFDRLRANAGVQAFLTGAGAAAIGAIGGSAVLLGLELSHLWQLAVLGLAAVWLLVLRRGVVAALLGAAALGVLAVAVGLPVP